jgi:hypothetical protein
VIFGPGSAGEKNAVLAVRAKEGPEATAALTGTAAGPSSPMTRRTSTSASSG